MMKPWIKEKAALRTYSPSINSRISPIRPKLMPPPSTPVTLAMRPFIISVIALPRIFGPSTMKAALAMAKIMTMTIATRYFPRYFSSFLKEPLKSLAFSPAMCMPPIGP